VQVGIEISQFKDIKSDVEFAVKLIDEEVVVVLPGRVFQCPNYIRLVVCPPIDKLKEAVTRIEDFCRRHQI
jgi:tyrosine aminotransferase